MLGSAFLAVAVAEPLHPAHLFAAAGAPVFAQVAVAGHGICAQVVDAWTSRDGVEFARVVWPSGLESVYPCRRVVRCSGLDGHCACAGECEPVEPLEGACHV